MDLNELKLTDKRKLICDKLGFNTVEDILTYYPFKYENYEIVKYDDFKLGSQVVFEAEVISSPTMFRKRNLIISKFKVLYEDNELDITIFNRPWIRNLKINSYITIFGKYEGFNKVTANNYYEKDASSVTGIIPSYSIKENITQSEIKRLIKYAYDNCIDKIEDNLPNIFKDSHGLINLKEAIKNIHFPENKKMLSLALSRLKYEEFLKFFIALNIIKNVNDNNIKKQKEFDLNLINEFINSFNFELTSDQIKTKDDVLNDLNSSKIMYRLIQGEVGSGKTAIAMIGLYANYLSGYQGALMAPTEILAKQHYESLVNCFKNYNIKIGLLYSAMDDEKLVKQKIKEGEYDIIVGTHALYSSDVEYKNLGLVIADEQHRFGVKQRKLLRQKGNDCDFILMSATPIPRTLASSLYGDMDISTIETLPKDRKGCDTYLIKENSLRSILNNIKDVLKDNRQVYIIAAAIEKSENYNAKDVTGLYESLSKELKPYNVSLMHGKLSSIEKDKIMHSFENNEIQVLISTTVVEVGVNVKNATMMIIYDADKFGLSQLHQLRGRIQRGNLRGSCYLLTDSKEESVLNRLNVLVNTNDGFKVSYEDLKLRGPGDILGTRQSGIPSFVLGNLIEDEKFIIGAKKDALYICDNLDKDDCNKYYSDILKIASTNYID